MDKPTPEQQAKFSRIFKQEKEIAKLKETVKAYVESNKIVNVDRNDLLSQVAKLKESINEMTDNLNFVSTKKEQLQSTLDEIKSPEFLEELASIEHEQWIEWATSLMSSEKLSSDRMIRWAILMVKYDSLTDGEKEQDRKYARLILKAIDKHGEIKCVI